MKTKAVSKLTGIVAATTMAVLASTWHAGAQEASAKSSPATITVTGTGQANVKPELARIVISVSTEAETAAKASAANRETSDKTIARIRALAIPADDVKTLDMQVFRTYSSSKTTFSGSSGSGFRAEHQIQITLRDLATVGKIAGELLDIDNMTLRSVTWDVNERRDTDDKARADAVADARHRAEIYANAAGVKLGKLLLIRDEARFNEPVPFRAMAADSGNAGTSIPLIPPATLTFSANAQMVWEILP